jgi:hypothetical protein
MSGAGGIGEPGAHLSFAHSGAGLLAPALFPVGDAVFADVEVAGNEAGGVSEVGQKNDPGPDDEDMGFVMFVDDGLQYLQLGVGDFDGNGFGSWHGGFVSWNLRDTSILPYAKCFHRTAAVLGPEGY